MGIYLDHVMIGVGHNDFFVSPNSEPMRRIQIRWAMAKLPERDTNVHSISTGVRRGRAQKRPHSHTGVSTDSLCKAETRIWKIKMILYRNYKYFNSE